MPTQAKIKFTLPRFPKTDKRLLGTWKSDARRTLKEWHWKKNLSPKRIGKCKTIFGKSEAVYTKTKIISRLRHRNWESAICYRVLGVDENSVAIAIFGEPKIKNWKKYDPDLLDLAKEIYAKPRIAHIHFVDNYYWISFGKNREFFRKIHGARK